MADDTGFRFHPAMTMSRADTNVLLRPDVRQSRVLRWRAHCHSDPDVKRAGGAGAVPDREKPVQ
jgi:hypothetical protein